MTFQPHTILRHEAAPLEKSRYWVTRVSRADCDPFVREIHYAQRWPSVSFRYGLERDGELVGVCLLGTPATANFRNSYFGEDLAPHVRELNRLALLDNAPNEASYLLAKSLWLLGKDNGPTCVISLADTAQDHRGTVYQAAGFTYVGLSAIRTDYEIRQNGTVLDLHNQTLTDLTRDKAEPGERRRDVLDRLFGKENVRQVPRPRKHRYVAVVGPPEFRQRAWDALRYDIRPFPKNQVTHEGAPNMATENTTPGPNEAEKKSAPLPKANGKAAAEPPIDDLEAASGFDLSQFIIDEEYEATMIASQTAITVGRPGKQTFFRCHPEFRIPAFILTIEDGLDKKNFLLTKAIAATLKPGEYAQRELVLLTSNFGELFLYPLGLLSDTGNKWIASAREAVVRSRQEWLRMTADRTMGQYYARIAEDQKIMGEPTWPDNMSPEDIIQRAFGEDSVISTTDHYAMQKLAGGAI